MIMSFKQKKTTTDIALEPQGINNGDMFCSLKINRIFLLGKNKGKETGD